MGFRIVTTASFDYASVVDFCLPSWRRHSGADEIIIRWHECRDRDSNKGWLRAVQERCQTIKNAVYAAVADKRKLLLMDADCVVLQDLKDGFADNNPIAVARWPNINMGVLFVNADMDWPFCEFFDEYYQRSIAHISSLIAKRSKRCGADQTIATPMLHAIEADVAKLNADTWNLPMSVKPESRDRLEAHKDTVRIIHLRIATSFGGKIEGFEFLNETFPGLL